MEKIVGKTYSGERSLFKAKDLEIHDAVFLEGESPLKEAHNVSVFSSTFTWKYPLWYSKNAKVVDSVFENESHAGFWYIEGASFARCLFKERKNFRHASRVSLKDSKFMDADETLWWCDDISGQGLYFLGNYVGMQSKRMSFDSIVIDGNYPFDGASEVIIKNSVLNSKDAFWNAHGITLENCEINGEYFGWNSSNVVLKRCKIRSHQGFCYMDDVTLIDCEIYDSDLTFEYVSNAKVRIIKGELDVKNPISGSFVAPKYKNIELSDDMRVQKDNLSFRGLDDGEI